MPVRPHLAWPVVLVCGVMAACIQPFRLAHDDSASVLAHHALPGPGPATPGSHVVRTLYYGSGTDRQRAVFRDSVAIKTRTVDGSKLAAAPNPALGRERKAYWGFGFDKMPVNGRVWYPEGEGPFPLVLIVHGNHNMKDFSDPGYGYLGRLLASKGYILASVDMNFLNGNIRGENDARGWMLLKHLEAWRGFADSAGSPLQGKVDFGRIALMGHSRGGEAVAVAGMFNRLTHYPDDATVTFKFGFHIRSLVAIAPVDGQYTPVGQSTPLENLNYLVVHGSHDGDVSSFSGLRQFERVRFTDSGQWFKSAVYMYRANHGQWNTVWGNKDNGPRSARNLDLRGLVAPEEQRRFLETYVTAFLDATLRDQRQYLPLFQDHRTGGDWLPRTMYVTRFQDAGFHALADYEDVDVTTGAVPGVAIRGDSLALWKEGRLPLRSRNSDMGHGGVWVGWNNRMAGDDTTRMGQPAAYAIEISDSLRRVWDIGSRSALVLSLAPTDQKPGPRKAPADSTAKTDSTQARKPAPKPPPKPAAKDTVPIDLSIEAVDVRGTSARVALSRYGPVRRPLEMTVYRRKGRDKAVFPTLYELVLQTYVIPLADLQAANAAFDPASVREVRLLFDRTIAGTVVMTDVGLSNLDPAFLSRSAR